MTAVVFVVVKTTERSGRQEPNVEAKVSYMQVIEANSMQTLGPKIGLAAASPDVLYFEGNECALELNHQRNVKPELGQALCSAAKVSTVAAAR